MQNISNIVIPNNTVFNNLIDAANSSKNIKSNIRSGVSTVFQITAPYDLTEFDLLIYSVICSIYDERGKDSSEWTFTPGEICRIINPSNKGGKSKHIVKEIVKTIDRLCSIRIKINAKQEFELHRKEFLKRHDEIKNPNISWQDVSGVIWTDANPLISLEKKEIVIKRSGICGNKNEIRYKGTTAPLLYKYSDITGQFVTIQPDQLNIKKINSKYKLASSLPMTKNRLAIIFRLARDIKRIEFRYENPNTFDKSSKNDNYRSHKKKKEPFVLGKNKIPTVLFSTLFSKCGINENTARRHLKNNIEFIDAVMNCWAVQGIIPAWEFRNRNEDTGGRTFIDALRFYPGTVSIQQQRAEEQAARFKRILIKDAKFGEKDTIFGEKDAKFGEKLKSAENRNLAQLSWFSIWIQTAFKCLKYCRYCIPDDPVTP